MGVYEEAKLRLGDLQKRIQRIHDAGLELSDPKATKTSVTKFKIMYTTLENLRDDFELQITTIIRHLSKIGSTAEEVVTDKIRSEFEEVYFKCKIIADEFLPEANSNAELNQTFIEPRRKEPTSSFLPIEKLAIPKFRGDPKEYTNFRNLFDTIIHENEHIKTVAKFGYLKFYLEGEPSKLVGNLMLTDRNYELALSQLTARYLNRRIIAESHLDELSNAPKATFSDGTSIRNLLNVVTESTGALENLTYPVDQWDPVLLHLLQKKLDQPLRAQWELLVDTTEDPTVKEFITFLTKYCKSASVSQISKEMVKPYIKRYKSSKPTVMFSSQQAQKTVTNKFQRYDHSEKKTFSCQVCNEQPGHLLIHCAQFKEKNPQERYQIIKDLNRCFMCFSEHLANQCKNTKKCYECGGRHHTMLHLRVTESSSTMPEQSVSAHVTMAATQNRRLHSSILLSTASVRIQNGNGHSVTVRALLDSASQSSFITEGCVKRLGLNRMKSEVLIQALAGTQVPAVRGKTNVVVCPVGCDEPRFMLDVLILTRITGSLPSKRIQVDPWPHLEGLSLADPQYNERLPIDLLIGADMFPYVVSGEKKQGDVNQPIAFSTVFGWVLMGRISSPVASIPVTMCSTLDSIDRTFKQFLEVENVPTVVKNTPEDIECEEIYKETTNRQPHGRYIVNLPFKQNLPLLGYSKDQALYLTDRNVGQYLPLPKFVVFILC